MRLVPPEELGMDLFKLARILLITLLFTLFFTTSHSAEIEHVAVIGNSHLQDSISSKSSTTNFYAEDIEKIPNAFLQDLVEFTPGLTFTGGTSKGRFFQMRGIGERSSYEGMPNYSVALVLDDIDYSGMGNVMGLSDLESVSVQRGPQLTVQGPNGIGGMISMKTKGATSNVSGDLRLGAGNFGTKTAGIYLGSPLSKNLSLSLNAQVYKNDGYIKNTYYFDKNTNSSEDKSLKAKLNYQASQWEFELNLHHFNFKDGYDVFNQSNSRTTFSDHPGEDNSEINAQSFKIERDFGSFLSSTTLTYLNEKSEYSYDEDWGNDVYWNNLPGYNANYNYNITFPKNRERMSVDQRVYISNSSRSNSHLGIYVRKDNETTTELGFKNEAQRKNIKANLKIEQVALYGQWAISLSEKMEMIFGARGEKRSSSYSDTQGNLFYPSELLWGAEASLIHYTNANWKNYLKVARAYKAGGVNTQPSVSTDRKEFDDEKLYLLELGADFNLSAGSYIKGATYLMYRDDIQVKTSYQDNPSDPSSYTYYQDNGSSALVYGAELEGNQVLTSNFSFKYGLGLMNSKFGNYNYGSRNLKDRELSYSPSYQFNISLDYQNTKGYFGSIRSTLQDNMYFGNTHDEKSKPNQLVHLSFGKDFSWGQIRLWSQNIFNERTELRGFYFSNEPPDWKDQRYVHLGPPRTFGVNTTFTY